MQPRERSSSPATPADPFREHIQRTGHRSFNLLGSHFVFESDGEELLRIVDAAYAGLPPHTLPGSRPALRVALELLPGGKRLRHGPGAPAIGGGAGFLRAIIDETNSAVVHPDAGAALVSVSQDMLRFPYQLRYELIEFAVYLLAARARSLVPLHAACVSLGRCGILLAGASGAGKSTLTLQCLAQGFKLVSEDSVMVEPGSLVSTGAANFLHLRPDSLQYVPERWRERVIGSPVIRRRSGVQKLEIDVRALGCGCAPRPVALGAIVFASPRRAGGKPLLTPVPREQLIARLQSMQPYGAAQPQWAAFARSVKRVPAFELRRGRHPQNAVEALQALLASGEK